MNNILFILKNNKIFLEKLSITFVERLLTISILNNKFSKLRNTDSYSSREELWSTFI